MEDAIANRAAVIAAMKRNPPRGGGDDPRKDKNDKSQSGGGDATPLQPRPPVDAPSRQPEPGDDGEPGDAGAPRPAPETAAERERRLANQAWLRRVPDDPGGLLRERFRLEQQRRRQGGD